MLRLRGRAVVALCAVAMLGTACDATEAAPGGGDPSTTPGSSESPSPSGTPTTTPTPGGEQTQPAGPAVVTVAPAADATKVKPDQPVTVSVASGTISGLSVKGPDGDELKGAFNAERSRWTGLPQLKPGARYRVTGNAKGTDGKIVPIRSSFQTLGADRNLKASVSPLQGATVGVGMPIQIFWNHKVTDKAAVERRLSVKTSVPVEGSWHWTDDKQVNWRPKSFWPARTKVTVEIATQGVNAGAGVWGSASRRIDFAIGKSVVTNVSVSKHAMVVRIDGKVARTIPITAGKAGFTTRSGTKVIMEKYPTKRMDSSTVGINPGDPEYYNIRNVRYAHRVTSSGEFMHGAPWSRGSQGRDNVSHGCVGMSLSDGAWYYSQTQIGDPVIVTGTKRGMEPGNGWTDWNVPWPTYKAASALS